MKEIINNSMAAVDMTECIASTYREKPKGLIARMKERIQPYFYAIRRIVLSLIVFYLAVYGAGFVVGAAGSILTNIL